ncbi:hypothetical protein DPMN_095975 [Dreissena polymorpha]|uniref:Uncharacterized protein n=1 Tax=Dreissena polymorpha TaxID=45954 RepID=A0A9D4LAH9_DREPO|nr:hypothetical protein DPMN_095975 [Dreissena polymorpha]
MATHARSYISKTHELTTETELIIDAYATISSSQPMSSFDKSTGCLYVLAVFPLNVDYLT